MKQLDERATEAEERATINEEKVHEDGAVNLCPKSPNLDKIAKETKFVVKIL